MKCVSRCDFTYDIRRAPQGARGLKFFLFRLWLLLTRVAPRKGRVG